MQTLSIIIPVYNEAATLLTVLTRIEKLKIPFKKQIIVVDDGSTDSSKFKV